MFLFLVLLPASSLTSGAVSKLLGLRLEDRGVRVCRCIVEGGLKYGCLCVGREGCNGEGGAGCFRVVRGVDLMGCHFGFSGLDVGLVCDGCVDTVFKGWQKWCSEVVLAATRRFLELGWR